ncbi:CDP-alcohol phosphatidyltransferase [Phycicoccus sp. Soil803]|uniref:CDP-alcohol phosphatidyltransferase n=1 Tax=Phycicoccus sp. Soil803 TaxID=1736415 RepID=UPI001F252FB2|nr:CDP-alcohol phosphatidyltransferase [Phycicoccus sp. Soil803]
MSRPDPADRHRGSRIRPVVAAVVGLVPLMVVWVVLVAPDDPGHEPLTWLLRLPLEPVLLAVLLLAFRDRSRRRAGLVLGAVLGAATLVKLLDIGFTSALRRPFDLLADWTYLRSARDLLADSVGTSWATAAVVGAAVVAVALLVVVPWSLHGLVRRLAPHVDRHRLGWTRAAVVLGTAWLVAAATPLQVAPGLALASTSSVGLVGDHVALTRAGLHDRAAFARAVATDPFAAAPAADLLTGLRGKDVLVVFVESYGEVAVTGTPAPAGVAPTLDRATDQLETAGYSIRSAWLDSPTFGGTSWLAHSTLQSGVWVDSQRRYDQLVTTDRLTLSGAFGKAGWRTVVDVPSNRQDWPEATSFYHYDQVYDARNVGYAGPRFGYATIPDQYTLEAFRDRELTPRPRAPVMAEIDLVTSHVPWAPLPRLVDWDSLGDGSVYRPIRDRAATRAEVWRDPASVRAAYAQSISYSIDSLVGFVQRAHDDDLVLVLLGDHQPSTVVSGVGASHRVPVTLVAHDPAVTKRIAGWGWDEGMRPTSAAPVWRMDAFRDRVLTAFGPLPGTGAAVAR